MEGRREKKLTDNDCNIVRSRGGTYDQLDQKRRWTIPGLQLGTFHPIHNGPLAKQIFKTKLLPAQFGCSLTRSRNRTSPHRTSVASSPNCLHQLSQSLLLRQLLPFRITRSLVPHHLPETRFIPCLKHLMQPLTTHMHLTRRISTPPSILPTMTGAWRGLPRPLPRLSPRSLNLTSGKLPAGGKRNSIARWYDICTNVHYSSFLSLVQPPELLDALLRHCQQVSQEIWPASQTSNEDNGGSGFDGLADMYVLKSRRLGGLHLVIILTFFP